MKTVFECIAAVAAFLAAGFWFIAARLPVAKYVVPTHGSISDEVPALNAQIQRGVKFNTGAAICAGVSALFQALALLISIGWQ